MDIFRDVEHNRKATDEKLLQERQRTDSLLAGVPATGADEILDHPRADADAEARLRAARDDVDAHLDRQAEILPKITETLEDVAESLTTAAESLTGVADTLKGSAAAAPIESDSAVDTLAEAAHELAGAASQITAAQPPRWSPGADPPGAPSPGADSPDADRAGDDTAVADAPAELVEKLAEIAGGVAEVAADLDDERQAADRKLRKERELTDDILGEQLERTESIPPAATVVGRGTLERERQATDRELAKERRHTDEAMEHVVAALAQEQNAHGTVRREFASRNDFLAVVSHDLRGPLTSISLAATLVSHLTREQSKGRELREIGDAAERIQRSASVMQRLIEDLLDFASFEDGKLRVAARQHDVRTLLERAVDLLRPLADAKSLELEVSLPPTAVHGLFDPDRMLQVVSNVLQNAIKFTPEGGTVRVRAAQAGRECLIAISDTGIGILEEELPKIFERFRQLDDDRAGLGLGLYISKWIVEAHRGRIWAESRRGLGSTFYIALPAEV